MTTVSVVDAGVPATTGQLDETAIEAAAAVAAAAAAQADADAAQADAAEALADAAAAQAAAATANANAIAANTAAGVAQATANGKNKVTYSTSAPGSTANALGDIWFQYGTTAPNVGRIIAQFTGDGGTSWTQTTISGLVVANIDAGNITTGTLTAAVGISNPSGNFSVNGATGALVCTGATVTGTIVATTGSFTGAVFASSGTFTGTVTATTGSFTGQVFATGGTFTGNVTTNANIQTSSGTSSVRLSGTSNSLTFVTSGSAVGHIVPLSSNGILTHYGATADPSGGTFPQMYVGSGNVSLFASTSCGIGVSTIISLSGDAYARQRFYVEDSSIATTAPNGRIDSDGRVRRTTGSSARFKENIVDLGTVGDMAPQQLLTLPVRAFTFKPDYLDAADNRVGVPVPGFIAEEVSEHYPAAADYDADGNPENWNERFLIPGMLALIQDLYKEIALLKGA